MAVRDRRKDRRPAKGNTTHAQPYIGRSIGLRGCVARVCLRVWGGPGSPLLSRVWRQRRKLAIRRLHDERSSRIWLNPVLPCVQRICRRVVERRIGGIPQGGVVAARDAGLKIPIHLLLG